MSTSRVDHKHRIELPGSQPGDVFEVQRQADGGYVLVHLHEPPTERRKTRDEILEAIDANPLKLSMTWEEIRKATRDL